MRPDDVRCADVQRRLSERLDGARVAGTDLLDRHVDDCPECQAFLSGAHHVRRALRFAPLDADVPEVVSQVSRRIREDPRAPSTGPGRWRLAVPVAASLIVGIVVGGLLADASRRDPSLAQELADRVVEAQHRLATFDAHVTVEEHGWHEAVPVRRYRGSLSYAAPEQLVIDLRDETSYADSRWAPNHVTRVVTADSEWSTAVPDCPRQRLPDCLPAAARTDGVTDRVPLSGLGARALDAVIPVESLHLGGGTDLGTRTVADGGQAVGVAADVAQLRPLLDALLGAGNWRELHPSDPVELWVDATALTPREITVRAAGGEIRERWALERGLPDRPGDLLIHIVLDPHPAEPFTPPSPPTGLRSAGFVRGEVDLPLPTVLPVGMERYLSGVQATSEHDVATVVWTDGRAWLRVRGVKGWAGGRLFGDLGPLVRRVTLPDGRVVYASGDGQAVAIHADGHDLLLEGTVRRETLIEAAASIPVDGRRVPADWAEAADATLRDATSELPGLLIPGALDGFGPPAVRVGDGQVVIGYAGSGGRELVLTQRSGDAVSPPVVTDVIGVQVRGRAGRYLPGSGELEWIEGGLIVSLRSDDLGLIDLLRVATDLRPLP